MLTSFSSRRNAVRSAFFATLALALVVAFSSCAQANQAPAGQVADHALVGNWKSQFDGYAITATTVSYNDGGYGYGWEGSDLIVAASDDTSGYIYCKYKSVGSGLGVSLVGKYYAIAYKKLTATSVSFSNAYKVGGQSGAATLEAAKAEFTLANGYFVQFSDCVKQ